MHGGMHMQSAWPLLLLLLLSPLPPFNHLPGLLPHVCNTCLCKRPCFDQL
jgi:hypothetical protein